MRWFNEIAFREYPYLAGVRLIRCAELDKTFVEESVPDSLVDLLYPNTAEWAAQTSDGGLDDSGAEEAFRENIFEALGLRTDALTDAVNSLEFVARIVPGTKEKLSDWKWVFVSLQSSLQGFMVNALVGTSFQNVLDSNDRLLDFWGLYKRIKSDQWMCRYTNSKSFKPIGTQGQSVSELNKYRDEFTHYTVKDWTIAPSVMATFPRILDDITAVVYFLAYESNNVHWFNTDGRLEEQTRELITQLHLEAENISRAYYEIASPIIGKSSARDFLLPRLKNKKKVGS